MSALWAAPAEADDWRTWVPVASALVAVLALLVTTSSRNTARKALALAQRQEERRLARVDVSLIDGISWRPAERGTRWIGMKVLAVNPTDRDGTLIGADLHVTYTLPSADSIVVKVPPSGAGVTFPDGIVTLEIPVRLPANGAVSGWFMYKVDDAFIPGPIDRYDAVIRDSRGPVETVQAWVLREVDDGATS